MTQYLTFQPYVDTAHQFWNDSFFYIFAAHEKTFRGKKAFVVSFQRSLKREHVIIKWILKVTHKDKDMSIDFAEWIRDGKILSL